MKTLIGTEDLSHQAAADTFFEYYMQENPSPSIKVDRQTYTGDHTFPEAELRTLFQR